MKILLTSRIAFILLAVISVTALMVRIYPVRNAPETASAGLGPFGDSMLYHITAYNLYKGHGFSSTLTGEALGIKWEPKSQGYEPAITRGPVYPFFISMVYRIFGNEDAMKDIRTWYKNWDKIRIVQCFLDSTVCILVFFISRLIFKESFFPALISSGLYCFSFYNIYFTRAVLSETIATFLLTVTLLIAILGIRYNKTYLWGIAGGLFGLVIFTRPEYILFPLMLIVSALLINHRHILIPFRNFLVFFAVAFMVVIPWTIRNYYVFKEIIPVSVSGLGMSVLLGTCETNDNWQGWVELPSGVFDSKEERAHAQLLYDNILRVLPLGNIKAKEPDHLLMKLAEQRICAHPFQCMQRWIIKIPRLWYQFYIPMYRDNEASGGFFIFYFLFALCALWKGTKEERTLMAPICFLFIYLTLVYLPLHVEPRYGVPLMPGIICMASLGIYKILSLIKWDIFKKGF